AVDGGDYRRRIAGLLIGGFPQRGACSGVEGDQAGAGRASDIHQDATVVHQRRTGRAEEAFADTELLVRVHSPDLLAAVEVEAMQRALGAEGVHAPGGDGGRGAWSFVETEIVAITGGVVERP